ncbi:histidine phosphatase family protein [Chitinimonas naiadis]
MTPLILLRHTPCHASAGRCYGRLDLAAERAPLRQAARMLRGELPNWPLYCSPARRCLALARQLAPRARVLAELQELDFGRWEGLPWADIPRTELDAWAADLWHYRAGGGESASDLLARWQSACRHLRQEAAEGAILVTHAGLIRLALAESGQLPEAERWSAPIAHAQPYRITI